MREYGYLEKMLDMLTDPYTHRDLQNVTKTVSWKRTSENCFPCCQMALRSSIKMPNWFGCGMTLKMLRAQSLTAMEPTLVYSAVQQVMPSTEF